MLTARAQGLAVILAILGIIGCLFKFDYNCALALGLILLGSKHGYLHRLSSFYFLIGATILVDIIAILIMDQQPFFSRILLTVLEIVLKIGILISLAMSLKKEKQQQQSGDSNPEGENLPSQHSPNNSVHSSK